MLNVATAQAGSISRNIPPLAAQLGLPPAPMLRSGTSWRQAHLIVTSLQSTRPLDETRASLPVEDAWAAHLHLRDGGARDFWVDGKAVATATPRAGTTDLHDLRHSVITKISGPLHCLHFHLPLTALDELADEVGAPRVGQLRSEPKSACADPVIHSLGLSLLPAFDEVNEANALFVDHVALAFRAHVARAYGGMRPQSPPARGGLAPWQERRAKNLMQADLETDIVLADIARECGLSVSYFARAFKKTTGLPPHRWLLRHRVERAKEMMQTSRTPLAEIALACGFADQSHFSRVFSQLTGVAPGAWQRQRRSPPVPTGCAPW